MRSRILIMLVVTGILVSFSGCGFMSKKYLKTKTEDHTISTLNKKRVSLENINGDILIRQSRDSSEMTISATKEVKVSKKDLDKPFDEITINIESEDDIIRITTEINIQRRSKFFNINLGNKATVDYVITVPAGLELKIENVNGNVTCNELNNDLTLNLVNGKTKLSNYSGLLECEIVNGSFTGEILSTKGIGISTVNGSITLNLNNYLNAEIIAETVNGKISDSNLIIKETERKKRKFRGILGSGTPESVIKTNTVNGKINFLGTDEI